MAIISKKMTLPARFGLTTLSALMLSILLAPAAPALANDPDYDGDGISNQIDLDDDNDGILDVNEGLVDEDNNGVPDAGSVDTDGDGTPDGYDLDSDNDGVLDNLETRTDREAVKALDLNPNGSIDVTFAVGANGIADAIETSPDSGILIFNLLDSDGDGVADFRDTDSDNDGIFDIIEAGGTDNNVDGRVDSFSDSDGKGVDDAIQSSALPLFDTDGDGTLDYRDIDSDGDFISDAIEGGNNPANPTDTDGDGAADYRENDSDGDGANDRTEAGSNPAIPADTNGNGVADFQEAGVVNDGSQNNGNGSGNNNAGGQSGANGPDIDGDGIANRDDLDDDNDGIPDNVEGLIDANGDGVADAGSRDSDGDGTPDGWDLDSDNDGLLDNREAHPDYNFVSGLDQVVNGAIDIGVAVGSNGLANIIETSDDSGQINYTLQDTDGDGTPDFMDLDSDGDGITDLVEAGGTDADGDGRIDNFVDADDKGVDDAIQASALPVFDTDGDGNPDYRDLDSDNDQIGDSVEAGSNPNQPADTDGDGAADYRETDSDGDGVSDTVEAGLDGNGSGNNNGNGNGNNGATTDEPDRDGDGIPNAVDLDDDNDGIPDWVEGLVGEGNLAGSGSRDTDGDGTPDGWDLDSDNDGLLDNREAHPDFSVVNAYDQIVNGAYDISAVVGANGIPDILETSPDSGELNFVVQDTDGDGTPDFMDLDSDNDTIGDLVEAGGVDADADGRIDNFVDADSKGVDDAIQASALPVFDTDNDGVADYRDTDSDADSVPDRVEAGNQPNQPADTDGDGAPDFREQDADNDNMPDRMEVGADPANPIDSDGNGVPDFQDSGVSDGAPPAEPISDDVDGDGIINILDMDDDNDGLLDSVEGKADSDGDTTLNQYDLDSDNDGVNDIAEAAELLELVRDLDIDGDGRLDQPVGENGYADILESTPDSGTSIFIVADSDNDGVPDFKDLDSDNDGIYDALESGRLVTDSSGRLVTAAGNDGKVQGASNALLDTDADGIVDNRDLDSDNDSLVDLLEARGTDSNGDGRIDQFDDLNGDGADDGLQRATTVVIDTDSDGVPDYRDLDSDQDSLSDLLETSGSAADLDNNGVLDGFSDSNGDGLDDTVAANPVRERDTDRDGIPDQVDLNSDGDGFSDLVEAGGTDDNNDGIVDVLNDADKDGIPDIADVSATGGVDSDQDGIDDMFDVTFTGGNDADGDGIDDQFDPDSDGNGFVGPLADNGQGNPMQLPDSNGDGTPDVQESAASVGGVETGLGGSGFGCSVSPQPKGPDPMLFLMFFASLASILWRSLRRVAQRPARNLKGQRNAGLVVVALGSLTLAGCSSLGLGGFGSRDSGDHKGRVYVGAGALVSMVEPDADKDPDVKVDENQSVGGSVMLGYDISNRFSIEAHGSDLGEATFEPSGSVGYQVGGVSALMYGLNDSDDRSRREGFSVFGRLGGGTMRNQGEGIRFKRVNDYHLLAGLGVEYGFQSGLAVRGEVVAHETDAKYAQLGLVYRIGDAGRRAPSRVSAPEAPEEAPKVITTPAITESVTAAPLDSDADGVADAVDSCPNSIAGTPVNSAGCALFNGAIEGINFESGSDRLTADSQQILSGVAATLQNYPEIRVSVEAHTDNQGSAESNLQLSKRRAIAVARYLVEQGVAGRRLQPQAYGESKPRETNATAEGRARNRRVEFNVVQ